MEQITANQDRIRFLDALRGIAVLCIFIANIGYFSGFYFIPPQQRMDWVLPSDDALDFIFFTLIDGKFYTIFSLLFGIGCAVQFKRMGGRKMSFASFFKRRMFWLSIIGLIHLCGLWLGDILTLYALLGFVLVYFVNVPNKNLLQYAAVLILFPIVNDLIIHGVGWNYPQFFFNLSKTTARLLGIETISDMADYLKNENLTTFFKANLSNTFIRISRILDEGRPFKVLGIFLIGLWAGRKMIFENLLGNIAFLKKVARWGILLGLPLSVFRTYIEFFTTVQGIWGLVKTIVYALGTVPLALGYAALLALLHHKKPNALALFEPVGKMALTNYISQTMIAIVLFYGVGFGLTGKFGFTIVLGIALCVFILQVIISNLWLRKFAQGPIEWLWRRAINDR